VVQVHVRSPTSGDQASLARIYREASLANPADREALLAHPDALRLSDDLISGGRARVAADADGAVLGFASTRRTGIRLAELDDLFTDPQWQRCGVARALVRRVVEELSGEGVTRLEVTGNDHALEFYRAVGFVVDGRTETEYGTGLRMHLDIEPDQRT
jgi:ribosomal protein S18 acetylase RimI-like enzyme